MPIASPEAILSRPVAGRGRTVAALVVLFVTSFSVALLLVWPEGGRPAAASGLAHVAATPVLALAIDGSVPDAVPAGLPVPDPAPPATSHSPGEQAEEERLAAVFAEPALIDLLEDASAADPQVREEAERILREEGLLPAHLAASADPSP